MRETAGEVEAAIRKMPRECGYCVNENDPTHCPECGLVWALEALTAERDARERAEREREEAERLRAFDTGTTPLPPGLMLEYERLDGMWRQLVAERDTLRERVAVLQAECQAGRAIRDREVMHEGFHPRRDTLCIRCSRLLIYDEARAATDAAGAMGKK